MKADTVKRYKHENLKTLILYLTLKFLFDAKIMNVDYLSVIHFRLERLGTMK